MFSATFILFGLLVLLGAGCSNKNVIKNQKQADTNQPAVVSQVSIVECAELMAFAPKIDLRSNDLSTSYPWTLKFYARMAELEKKYSITQDELAKICETKKAEPGFAEEVKRQEEKLK